MGLIFKISIKCNSFNVTIGIKAPFFSVLVTNELGRSLLQFVTTNCFISQLHSKGRLWIWIVDYAKPWVESINCVVPQVAIQQSSFISLFVPLVTVNTVFRIWFVS